MHALHEYLAGQLKERLEKRRVVVFYDPRREFDGFMDEVLSVHVSATDESPVTNGRMLDLPVRFLTFRGSLIGLKLAAEPLADGTRPDPLLIYLPGVEHDRRGSVLMELERAGETIDSWSLKQMARNCLRKHHTDGVIDELLSPDNVSYDDVVIFLDHAGKGGASRLKLVFSGSDWKRILAAWLADPSRDAEIDERDATSELYALVEARLGLELGREVPLAHARTRTARYVLANEFRSDLQGDAPASLAKIPEPPSREHVDRVRDLAQALRDDHAEAYVTRADQVAQELRLADAKIPAGALGAIDTFRFEEELLFRWTGEQLAAKRWGQAARVIEERGRSFWVDRSVDRQAQWEACRRVADLGLAVDRARKELPKVGDGPGTWVERYVADDGWHLADRAHRALEAWVSQMEEEPECEQGLQVARRAYDDLLQAMAAGFVKRLGEAGWTVPGVLHQTRIHPDVVEAGGKPVAYFFVDAMRYEMGAELAGLLRGVKDLHLRPAIGVLPSITPIGMAALLPGASGSFSVVEHEGKLAARIEGANLHALKDRQAWVKARVPDAVDLDLGGLLGMNRRELTKAVAGASLVVVRSQEIDMVGELEKWNWMARQFMSSVLDNIARAVRRLAGAGIERFVITADHGHLFSIRKDEALRIDSPGGDKVELHRRCWIGRGGTTPPASERVSAAALGYDSDLEFVFPTGNAVFSAGGGLAFHHGGPTLQELVIPVLSFRVPTGERPRGLEPKVEVLSVPPAVTNRVFVVKLRVASTFGGALQVVLMRDQEQVGKAAMVHGAEFDRGTGIVRIDPGRTADVVLMLTGEPDAVRLIVQDPDTGAELAPAIDLPVKLSI